MPGLGDKSDLVLGETVDYRERRMTRRLRYAGERRAGDPSDDRDDLGDCILDCEVVLMDLQVSIYF